MNWLKNKLKKWLFKEELSWINETDKKLEQLQQKINQYDKLLKRIAEKEQQLNEANKKLEEAFKITEDAKRIVNSIVDVGVDVEPYEHSGSWAVLCVDGKPNYMKFVRLDRKDTRELISFLKRFEYSPKRTIDSPYGFDADRFLEMY